MEQLELLREITQSFDWATIDEIVIACDRAGDFWPQDWLNQTTVFAKKSMIRRLIRQIRSDDGSPAFHSIVQADENGNEVRVYKQQDLFNVDDYLQTINYNVGRAQHFIKAATDLRSDLQKTTSIQLKFPWE